MSNIFALSRYADKNATDIASTLIQGTYRSIVGPRLTGKTSLVLAVIEKLRNDPIFHDKHICVYFNLRESSTSSKEVLYSKLAKTIVTHLEQAGGLTDGTMDVATVTRGPTFVAFLEQVLLANKIQIILILDHLESVPDFIVKSLLDGLRKIYMEKSIYKHNRRLTVLVAGTVAIERMTSDKLTSPFSTNKLVISDLSREEVIEILGSKLHGNTVLFSKDAIEYIAEATQGHVDQISSIIDKSLIYQNKIYSNILQSLEKKEIELIIQDYQRVDFPNSELFRWTQEMLIREHANIDFLARFLSGEVIRYIDNPMESSLELSGILLRDGSGNYSWRNKIYEQATRNYYTVSKLSRSWAYHNSWNTAYEFAKTNLNFGDLKEYEDFLSTSISAISEFNDTKSSLMHILTSISVISKGKAMRIVITNKNISKVAFQVENDVSQSSSQNPFRTYTGQLLSGNEHHRSVTQALHLGEVYYESNSSGNTTCTFPIIYNGIRYGVLQVTGLFQQDEYWQQFPLVRMLEKYATTAAKPLLRIRAREHNDRLARYWKIFGITMGIVFFLLIIYGVINYLTPLVTFPYNVLPYINTILLMVTLTTVIFMSHNRLASDLVRNILAGLALTLPLFFAVFSTTIFSSPILLILLITVEIICITKYILQRTISNQS